jgi:succinate dehydrogenase flavin-adding protein (antitoxin of CptAB toxin-antitoxin module)
MTPTEKSNLNKLLEQQDPDLLDWFLGKSVPKDSIIAQAVRHVLAFSNNRKRENGA